jgi:hypothetical protein
MSMVKCEDESDAASEIDVKQNHSTWSMKEHRPGNTKDGSCNKNDAPE